MICKFCNKEHETKQILLPNSKYMTVVSACGEEDSEWFNTIVKEMKAARDAWENRVKKGTTNG